MGINRVLVPSRVSRISLLGTPWSLPGMCPHLRLGFCMTLGLLCEEMVSLATVQGPVSSCRCWTTLSGLGLQPSSHLKGGQGEGVALSPPFLRHTLRRWVKSSLDLRLQVLLMEALKRPEGDQFFHSCCSASVGGEGLVRRWFNGKYSLD